MGVQPAAAGEVPGEGAFNTHSRCGVTNQMGPQRPGER